MSGAPTPGAPTPPSLALSDLTQSTGSYVVGDNVKATATTVDTDGRVTTGVQLYESGVFVGAMLQGPTGTWVYTGTVTAGAKSYKARRLYTGGFVDSVAVPITVLDYMAPNQITSATLIQWARSSDCTQMGGTLNATGTTPPAVTISSSSTLVGRTEGVYVDIIVGGARGTATVSVSIDNGATFVLTAVNTAATIAIPGTDLTLAFPVGTYNANNLYEAICSVWCDKVGAFPASTNNYSNTAANNTRPKIRAASQTLLGAVACRFDGADDFWDNTGTVGTAAFAGTDHTNCLIMLVDLLAIPAGGVEATLHCASSSTDVDQVFITTEILGTQPSYTSTRRGDTGTQKNVNSNVMPFTGFKLIESSYDGTNHRYTVNTADVIGGDSGVTSNMTGCGAITTTEANIGCRHTQSGRVNFGNFDLYESMVFSTLPSTLELYRLRAYFQR